MLGEPKKILQVDAKHLQNRSFRRFPVKWKDYLEDEASWHREIDFNQTFPPLSLRTMTCFKREDCDVLGFMILCWIIQGKEKEKEKTNHILLNLACEHIVLELFDSNAEIFQREVSISNAKIFDWKLSNSRAQFLHALSSPCAPFSLGLSGPIVSLKLFVSKHQLVEYILIRLVFLSCIIQL